MSGIERLKASFDKGHKVLVPYLTAGDPDLETTHSLLVAVADAGADIIELGVPFSDPMADGPVLQLAAERALKNPFSLDALLELVARFRQTHDTPLILFGYFNPFLQFGIENLAKRAVEVGVDGLLCVDLPPEEAGPLVTTFREHGLAFVPLLTPVSGPDRIAQAASVADAFGYYVSVTGVTGLSLSNQGPTEDRVAQVREALGCPMVVGFGVRTPEDAARVSAGADGAVVGTALVRLAHETPAPDKAARVAEYIASLKQGLTAR